MHYTEIHKQARMLKDAHGARAIAEAAQKAQQYEQQGRSEDAQDWRRIEAALREMHGPRES